MAGTVTARVSVLPDVGSELPTDSGAAAMVCTALVDENVDDALDVVGLSVGQSCLRTDSAQLWRCPVTWYTVWKGTAQDCVDHMRRAHDILPLVKAANLAHWFPPWTVTREQWSSMSQPAVSGIAVDTLLFSRLLGCRCSTGIGSSIVRDHMGHSVAHTCDGCILFCRNRMRHHCEGVIIDTLGILQHGCRRHLFGTRRSRRPMFLLDPEYLVGRSPGSGGLPSRRQWPAHRWPRELFTLIVQREALFEL